MRVLVINGPNLNFLGIREPEIYGSKNYGDLVRLVEEKAKELGIEISFLQSNHEGIIVDAIQEAYFKKVDGIIINPAAYTHTSVAILDAVKAVSIPTVEVHISQVDEREEFRKISYIGTVAIKTIAGKGFDGYVEALEYLKEYLEK